MPLITVIIVLDVLALVIVGLHLVNRYLPMDDKIKTILNLVVVVVVLFWVLNLFGFWAYLSQVTVPRVR